MPQDPAPDPIGDAPISDDSTGDDSTELEATESLEPWRGTRRPDPPAKALAEPRGAPQLARGDAIGRLLVLELLGRGGMGEVYSAYDPELDRRVAVKLLRARRQREESHGQARLMREAQALARLNHANVITAYDVGTHRGRVFLSMEYVEGETLHAWLQKPRSPEQIVTTFRQAGRGLAAAHHAGLIHRDFKPGNVMVAKDGRVLVLDFGLARAREGAEEPAGEGPVMDVERWSAGTPEPSGVFEQNLTRVGSTLGTPAYMAPEQVRGETTTAASDQFSFCVALHHALFGVWPYEQFEHEPWQRLPPPSTPRLPARWRRALARGLELSPDVRHRQMDDLLHELRPTARRSRWATAIAAALTLLGGVVFLSLHQQARPCGGSERHLTGVWDAAVEEELQQRFTQFPQSFAADSWRLTRDALAARADAWTSMHRSTCEATRITGEQSERLLDLRMECLFSRLEEMRTLTGLLTQADAALVTRSVASIGGLPPLAGCAETRGFGNFSAMPQDSEQRQQIRAVRDDLARARAHLAAFDDARAAELAEPAVDAAEPLGYWPLVAEAYLTRGVTRSESRRPGEALEDLQSAVLAGAAGGHEWAITEALTRLVRVAGYQSRDFAAGRRYAAQAGAALHRLGAGTEARAELADAEGTLYFQQGQYQEAIESHQAALRAHGWNPEVERGELGQSPGPELSPRVAATLLRLGNVYLAKDQRAQARRHFEMALGAYEGALGPHHPQVAFALDKIGSLLMQESSFQLAYEAHRRALEISEESLGPHHRQTASTRLNAGVALQYLGRYDEALDHLGRAVEDFRATWGDEHPQVSFALGGLAVALGSAGQREQALTTYLEALTLQEKSYDPEHPWVAATRHNVAESYRRLGRCDEALPHYLRARAAFEKADAGLDARVADTLTGEGRCLEQLGRSREAVERLERALTLRRGEDDSSTRLAETRFALARALTHLDPISHRDRSVQLGEQAAESYRAAPQRFAPKLEQVEAWLRVHGAGD